MSNPPQISFTFGDSEALCSELIALVRSGAKTATCGALRDFGEGGEAMPVVGRRDIALNWDGTPALEIETVEVFTCRFDEVSEDFALAEGEDESLAGWRAGHEAYFTRNGGFSPDMMLVCERFRVVRDLAEGDPDAALPPQ
ncbi:ASCH domain-containing protein [Pseudooceanicola antarcticus]|uniref:ASCH domain-containing protein n=1 Tax=Pseudooceanicola antarcticus TaxID=1247613 RepID=A0ABX4MQV3_9RHOB|nr:ASCH domain-containing protein [Pseudooceanicola antarcticus]PJE30431.1 ASCH domain-containing protein [Pseudooceanicola antarcticus]